MIILFYDLGKEIFRNYIPSTLTQLTGDIIVQQYGRRRLDCHATKIKFLQSSGEKKKRLNNDAHNVLIMFGAFKRQSARRLSRENTVTRQLGNMDTKNNLANESG